MSVVEGQVDGTVEERAVADGAVDDGAPDHGAPDHGAPDHGAPDDGALARAVRGLSYEQARDELVEVVRRLETGGEPLEESLALWERGEALAARCQEWLDGARVRLEAARTGSSEPGGQR